MKAVKKPIEIDVMEWTDNSSLPAYAVAVEKTKDGWRLYNRLHGCWINFETGDFLNITLPSDVYPIKRSVFLETYDVVGFSLGLPPQFPNEPWPVGRMRVGSSA